MKTGKFLAILAVASLGIASSANAAAVGTAVPEPSTYIAGVLLLLPFGVSALRSLRRKQ